MKKDALIRCNNCNAINKIPIDKIASNINCGSCQQPLVISDKIKIISSANFDKEIKKHHGYFLLVFYSDTCGYCHKLIPVIEKLAKTRKGLLSIGKTNTMFDQQLPQKFNIQGVPNLFLFKKGIEVANIPGYVTENELIKWLERF